MFLLDNDLANIDELMLIGEIGEILSEGTILSCVNIKQRVCKYASSHLTTKVASPFARVV